MIEKIKPQWTKLSVEMVALVVATLSIIGALPSFLAVISALLVLYLFRRRSIVAPFLALFTVLLIIQTVSVEKPWKEQGVNVGEVAGERLERLSQEVRDRVAEDEMLLRTTSLALLESVVFGPEGTDRPRAFETVNSAVKEGEGRGMVLFDQYLGWTAWSGKIRGISAGMVRESLDRGPVARLHRGPVFTVLTMSYPVIGRNGEPAAVLFLSDLLSVEGSLERVALVHRGFMDRLGGRVGEWGILVPAGTDEPGVEDFSVEAFGKRVATLRPAEQPAVEGLLQLPGSATRIMTLLLVFPWLLISWAWLKNLDEFARCRMDESTRPVCWLFFCLTSAGSILLLLRIAFLEMGVPGEFWDLSVFSPNLFASGFFDYGSRSVGDFFISSFLVLVLTFLFLFRSRSLEGETRGSPGSFIRIVSTVSAILLPAATPMVLQRLLRDTAGELLVYGHPLGSAAFVLWEGALFMLLLSTIFVAAALLRIAHGGRGKKLLPLFVYVVTLGTTFYLLVFHPEKNLPLMRTLLFSLSAVAASFIVSGMAASRNRLSGVAGSFSFLTVGALLVSLLLFPFTLEKRYHVLMTNAQHLFEVARKPIDTWVTYVLEEFIEEMEERRVEILRDQTSPELAFALWAGSRLSSEDLASSLSIYDLDGIRQSTFSLLAESLDDDLIAFLRQEVSQRMESFIYTGFVGEEQGYIATIPLIGNDSLEGMLLARLPTGLKRRVEAGINPFMKSEATLTPGTGVSLSLVTPEGIPWDLRDEAEGVWLMIENGSGADGSSLASSAFIDVEGKWLLITIPVMGLTIILGQIVAAFFINCLFTTLAALSVTFHFKTKENRQKARGVRSVYGTFRARLTISLFVFSLIPTLIWGLLSRGTILDRIDRETRTEAQRILLGVTQLIPGGEVAAEQGDSLLIPRDDLMLGLSEAMGAELFLYSGNMLVSSSRPDLVQSGIMTPWIGSRAYVQLFLEGKTTARDRLEIGTVPYMMVYSRLDTQTGTGDFVLATPMLLRQEQARREVVDLNYKFIVAVMAILAGSIFMGLIVASFLSNPLAELRRGTRQIAGGNLDYQLETKRFDEFGELYESFNDMARRLRTSHLMLLSEKSKIESILSNVGAGVVVLSDTGQLMLHNGMASSLLRTDLSPLTGKTLYGVEEIPQCMNPFLGWASDTGESGEQQFRIETDEGDLFLRSAKTVASSPDKQILHVVIFEDVTEGIKSQRVLAWADLARQIAHEIKNPLTPIRLAVQHMRRLYRDRAPDYEQKLEENVELVMREIDRLGRTASQFSTFAKAENARGERVDISPVLHEVFALYGMDEGDVKCRLQGVEDSIMVMSDREGFRRVLINLLENARDAMAGAGTISMSLEETTEWVVLTVTDTGEGIPPEVVGKVFEPDFTTRTDGTGLGLTIVKRLIEGWGGRITIESEIGRGTTVKVCLRRS